MKVLFLLLWFVFTYYQFTFRAKHLAIDKEIKVLQDEQKKINDKTRELNLKVQQFLTQNEKFKQQLAEYNMDIMQLKAKIQNKSRDNRTQEEWTKTFELYHNEKNDKSTEKQAKIQEIAARKVQQNQQKIILKEMSTNVNKYKAQYYKVHDDLSNLDKVVRLFEKEKDLAKKTLEDEKRKIVVLEREFQDWKNKYETARAEALELSNGRELTDKEIAQNDQEFKAMERERIKKEEALKAKHGNNRYGL